MSKRWFIIGVCLVLAVARIIFPAIQVDTTTVWLMAIAALLFVLPDLAPYVKRIKYGDAELELKEKIERVEQQVEKTVAQKPELVESKDILPDVAEIYKVAVVNPQAALSLVASKIEAELRKNFSDLAQGSTISRVRPLQAVELGVKEGLYPQDFLATFRDFWNLRNMVAHGLTLELDSSTSASMIDLGISILQIVASKKREK